MDAPAELDDFKGQLEILMKGGPRRFPISVSSLVALMAPRSLGGPCCLHERHNIDHEYALHLDLHLRPRLLDSF